MGGNGLLEQWAGNVTEGFEFVSKGGGVDLVLGKEA